MKHRLVEIESAEHVLINQIERKKHESDELQVGTRVKITSKWSKHQGDYADVIKHNSNDCITMQVLKNNKKICLKRSSVKTA